MLRRVGSRPELAIGRKHCPVGQFRHSGTKFNPWQHNCTGKHRHTAGRHNSDDSRFDIPKWDLSECNYPGLQFPQRDA
jgi:hypothetical protein